MPDPTPPPERRAPVRAEETLDPADWGAMRDLAHRMVDEALGYLETVRERPAWRPVPDEARAALRAPLPLEPEGAEAAWRDFREHVLPYPMGNIHPRFWGWYMGSGTVLGALGDFLAAVMNPNLGGGSHAAPLVEEQVIRWCREMLGFPEEASGLMTAGASMANLVGLAVARQAGAGVDVRGSGMAAVPAPLVVYGSSELHSCHQKAVELMGMGASSLRRVATDAAFRIDVAALERAVAEDRRAGRRPLAVIGSAGTINTGAVDDLGALAELCAREGLWFHVDGAIGALVTLAPSLAPLVAGIERADSVALDLHKWMHVPFEAGVALVRHERVHREAFSLVPAYLEHGTRGVAGAELWFSDYGVDLTRGFKALKVWLSIKEHGARRYGRLMEQNVAQARHLAERIEREAELELLLPPQLDVVVFRYDPGDRSEAELDALNRELLVRVHESGVAVPSSTTLAGRTWLRVAIANHRSTRADFDLFVDALLELGRTLAREG